jgi:hypothetical protein
MNAYSEDKGPIRGRYTSVSVYVCHGMHVSSLIRTPPWSRQVIARRVLIASPGMQLTKRHSCHRPSLAFSDTLPCRLGPKDPCNPFRMKVCPQASDHPGLRPRHGHQASTAFGTFALKRELPDDGVLGLESFAGPGPASDGCFYRAIRVACYHRALTSRTSVDLVPHIANNDSHGGRGRSAPPVGHTAEAQALRDTRMPPDMATQPIRRSS